MVNRRIFMASRERGDDDGVADDGRLEIGLERRWRRYFKGEAEVELDDMVCILPFAGGVEWVDGNFATKELGVKYDVVPRIDGITTLFLSSIFGLNIVVSTRTALRARISDLRSQTTEAEQIWRARD